MGLFRWRACCAPSGSCLPCPASSSSPTDGPEGRDPTVADNFLWEPSTPLAANTRYTVDLAARAPGRRRWRGRSPRAPRVHDDDGALRGSLPSAGRHRGRVSWPPGLGPVHDAHGPGVDRGGLQRRRRTARRSGARLTSRRTTPCWSSTRPRRCPTRRSSSCGSVRGARAADGTPLDRPRAARFTVAAKPEPEPTRADSEAGLGREGRIRRPDPPRSPS